MCEWEHWTESCGSKVSGFDSAATMFPAVLYPKQAWSHLVPISLCVRSFPFLIICPLKPQCEIVGRGRGWLGRDHTALNTTPCSMEHFKTQRGAAGHNLGISAGSQV